MMTRTAMMDQTLTFLKSTSATFDQVFRHGALAGDDALRVNGFDEGNHLVQLVVDGVRAGLIGAVGKDQLVAAGLQDLHDAVGQQLGLEARAGDGIQTYHLRDAIHVLEFIAQVAHLSGGQVVMHQNEVAGGHAEVLAQLVGATMPVRSCGRESNRV